MIISKSNPRIKEIRLLKLAKNRRARREFLIEGVRLLQEALRQQLSVRAIVYSPKLEGHERGAALLSSARKKVSHAEWVYVSDQVLASISETQSHQGVLAILDQMDYSWSDLKKREGVLLLFHELQDPGNLGTIFRLAEAGGSAGLVLSRGSVDPYSPKVVRASMGSLFRVPFLVNQNLSDCLKLLHSGGKRVLAAQGKGGLCFWEADLAQTQAILFGQEGAGIPAELAQEADGLLTIPMIPPTESLNVAAAAGLVIYEAWRQRKTVRSISVRG